MSTLLILRARQTPPAKVSSRTSMDSKGILHCQKMLSNSVFSRIPISVFLCLWTLGIAEPSQDEFKHLPFPSAHGVLRKAVKDQAFPGCVAAVGTSREMLWMEAFGHLDYQHKKPVYLDTWYLTFWR